MRRSALPLIVAASLLIAACGGGKSEEKTASSLVRETLPPTTTTTTTIPKGPFSTLTGKPINDDVAARPVVAVKIDNVDGKSTPQSGITAADVVYEIQVEAQVTRLLSLFQTNDAGPIGPVRSARGSEVDLLEEMGTPYFVWHGANDILRAVVRSADIVPRSIDDVPSIFYRQSGRPAPYNSFIQGTVAVRDSAPDRGVAPTIPLFVFRGPDDALSPHATPVSTITVRFPPPFGRGGGESPAEYTWDGSKFLRVQNGHPHVDTEGRQVAVDNVIVRFTTPVDSGTIDKSGARVPTAAMVGEGDAWIFTDGHAVVGRWSKPDKETPARYVDADGVDVALTPGTTWVSFPYGVGSSSFS